MNNSVAQTEARSDVLPPRSAFHVGFDAYCKGASIHEMPTEQHRRGWWCALDGEAAFSAEQHMDKVRGRQ